MDEEELNGVAGDDLDQSMAKTTNAVGNVAGKAADKGKKYVGEKIKNTKPMRKVQAIKHEVQQGGKKIVKGARTTALGGTKMAAGAATQAAGAALRAAGAGLAATGVGAPVAKALDTAGQGLQKAGGKVIESGKKTVNKGKERIKAGGERIKNAPNADPDKAPSDDDDNDDSEDQKIPGVPNPKKTIKMLKNMLKDLMKMFLKKYKWILIGILAGIIGIFFLLVLIDSSKEKSGKYIEGDYSNVPFVVDTQIIDKITIASDGQGGYRYAVEAENGNIISIDEAIDNALDTLKQYGAETTLNYLGSTDNERRDLLKKMVQAEVATQFPDLNIQGVGNYQGTVNWGGETISNSENGLEARTFTFSDGETWNYNLYVPENVNENKPLIVYQHGNGHQGHDFSMLNGGGSDHSFSYLITRGESFNSYILEPQLPSGHWWDNNDVDKLKTLVDHVVAENGINPNRVSLWGFSMGSERIEYNVNKYPSTYSSMVICARNTGHLQGNIRSDFPIYLVYDRADGYSNTGTPGLYTALSNAGYTNVHLLALNEGMGHYETVTRAIHNQDVMSWALGQAGSGADMSQLTPAEPVTENTPVGENFVSTTVDENVEWGWITQWENPESYYYKNGFGVADYDDPAVNKYITEDGIDYIVQGDPISGLWVGQGVELNEDNLAKLRNHGVNTDNIEEGSTMNADAVDDVSREIFRERKVYVKEEAKKRGLEFSDNQIIALVNIYYEQGSVDKQLDQITNLGADNDKIAKKVKGFARCDEDEKVTSRKELNWKLYKYGLYESAGVFDERYFNGMEESGSRVSSRVFKGKNKFNGSIHVQRRDEDGNDVDLSYTDEKTFNQMISENSEEALNYYTLKKTKKTNQFSSNTSANQGELFAYVASWENGALLQYQNGRGSYNNGLVKGYITEDGQSYICRTDEGCNNGTKNYGFGVMVNQYGKPNNVEYFAEEGIDITDSQYLKEHVSTLPVEMVNKISKKIQNDKVEFLKTVADRHGVTLNEQQQHALVDIMYQFGDYGANLDRFMELYKQYGNTEALRDNYTSIGGCHVFRYVPGGTNQEGVQRGESHWLLFHDGEYHYGVVVDWDVSSGNTSTSNSSENESSSDSSSSSVPNVEGGKVDSNGVTITSDGNHEFLQAAIAAHEYGRNKGLTYSGAGRDVLPNASTPSRYTYTDCSTYVSFALEWYGFTEWRNYSWQESTGNYHELVPSSVEKLGNEKMETVFSGNAGNISEIPNIQSGDIVIIPGHTQIFYGYNSSGTAVWLNAGSTGAIARQEGQDAYNDIIGGFGKYITKVYRVPDGSGSFALSKITSLDNFLFIGDSRYSTIDNQISSLGSEINNQGVGSARIDEWISVASNGGKGTVQGKSVDISGDYPGISVQLGANSVGNGADRAAEEMKEFLNKLRELHPGTPIFVNSCLGVNSNATAANYSWDPSDMRDRIHAFNSEVSKFCNQNSDLYYVDIAEGLEDENGFVKSEYESDGLHLTNPEAISLFTENLKSGILEIGASSGKNKEEEDKTSDDTSYVILVANRKDTNTITTENYEYLYSYGINKNSGVTSSGLGKQFATPSDRVVSSKSTKQYSSSKVDYQEAMKKNTLYFDFLWALLVDSSGDRILVGDLADLAAKSEVDLTAYTEKKETQSTNRVSNGTVPITNYDASSVMAYYDVYRTVHNTTTTTMTITSKCAITKADTWLVDYENDAKDYNTFKKRTEEKTKEKTNKDSLKTNAVTIFARDTTKLGELQKSEYIMERMLSENSKVDYMIDVYKYILSLAGGNEEIKTNLSGIGIMDTSVYDLSNSSNLVAKMQLMYTKLKIDDDDKELLYKAVETICVPYGDNDENTERKKAVTSVILNRVMSSNYPNSVKKVLKQRRQFPNFQYSDISKDVSISDSTKAAVDEVLEKGDHSDLAIYILTEDSNVSENYKATEVKDSVFKYYNTDNVAQELRKYQVIVGYVRGNRKGRRGSYSDGFTPEEDPYSTGTMGIYKIGDRAYSAYIQGNNSVWASIPYSHENMAGSACGATSVAIIASSVDPDITPVESGKAIYEYIGAPWGTNADGATDIGSLSAALNKFGIRHEWKSGVSKDEVIAHLEQGLPVIVLVHDRTVGDAHYGGHYLTLLGMNDEGEVFVGDPARGGANTMYHSQDKLNIDGLWICFITFD